MTLVIQMWNWEGKAALPDSVGLGRGGAPQLGELVILDTAMFSRVLGNTVSILKNKKCLKPGVVVQAVIPAFGWQRLEDHEWDARLC